MQSYEDFIASISFRFIRPRMRIPEAIAIWMQRGHEAWREAYNLRVRGDRRNVRGQIRPLCILPRMSTIAIGCLLNEAVHRMDPAHAYVNVGVWYGFSFFCGACGNPRKTCIAVDNFSQFGGPRQEFLREFNDRTSERQQFHDLDYRDYFARVHRGPIGVYFYDGDHAYAHQLEGLRLAEPHFAPGCIIFVDDTNWDEPRRATEDFLAAHPGEYETLLDVRTSGNRHPTWWNGLIVLRKR